MVSESGWKSIKFPKILILKIWEGSRKQIRWGRKEKQWSLVVDLAQVIAFS